MSERLDALAVREYLDRDGNKKTAFTKIGVAFPTKSGGYSVQLDAMPAPTEGVFKILLMVPKPREDRPRQNAQEPLDDQVPF